MGLNAATYIRPASFRDRVPKGAVWRAYWHYFMADTRSAIYDWTQCVSLPSTFSSRTQSADIWLDLDEWKDCDR